MAELLATSGILDIYCYCKTIYITVRRVHWILIYLYESSINFTIEMLLSDIRHWAPFRLDALGIVTLLGATELDLCIGRLVRNRLTEGLPVLAAYIVASNSIIKPIPGFVLHNISDGILATDITGWFARWLLCQNSTFASSVVSITLNQRPASKWDEFSAYIAGSLAIGPLLVLAILMGDWWGLVNGLSMLISVLVRRTVVGQNRAALDLAASRGNDRSKEMIKTFWALPTGTAITILAPRGVILDCLLTTPRPPHPRLYNLMRALGWLGFGCHVVSLGMASLVSQLLSLFLLLAATVLVVYAVGDEEAYIGSQLLLERKDSLEKDFRAATYARLNLSESEEASMVAWNLFPHKSNEKWWDRYRDYQDKKEAGALLDWDTLLGIP